MAKFKVFTGIVLRHIKYDEAEKLFIIITPTGKAKAFAKGVRKVTSKNSGNLELFTHAHIQTVEGNSNRYIITSSVSIDRFDSLAYDIQKYTIAMFSCEMIDKFSQENDDNGYIHLLIILKSLRDTIYSNNDILYALAHISMAIGIYPSLEVCAVCGSDNTPTDIYYSYENGGIVCHDCHNTNSHLVLTLNSVKILRNTYRNMSNPMSYNISKEHVKIAADIIYKQVLYNMDNMSNQIKTWKMIEDIILK
jgi:DNA repair protein RecO (recombination protein O)